MPNHLKKLCTLKDVLVAKKLSFNANFCANFTVKLLASGSTAVEQDQGLESRYHFFTFNNFKFMSNIFSNSTSV
jgi:hypothetical protein